MKLIIQDVDSASVKIVEWEKIIREDKIQQGILIYFSVSKQDCESERKIRIDKFVEKLPRMRFLKNKEGKLIATLWDVEWAILVVSNFTLYGSYKNGTKVDFSLSGSYGPSKEIYDYFLSQLSNTWFTIKSWEFGWMMKVESVNNWPINYILEI